MQTFSLSLNLNPFELKTHIRSLYKNIHKEHFIPNTLILLDRPSLIPGSLLVKLLKPQRLLYSDAYTSDIAGIKKYSSDKILIFSLYLNSVNLTKNLKRLFQGNVFRTACLFYSLNNEPDFYISTLPNEFNLEVIF